MQRVLCAELGRHLAPRLIAQNLFPSNPTVSIDQTRPRLKDFLRKFGIPRTYVEEMESFIPVEATRKGTPAWCARE